MARQHLTLTTDMRFALIALAVVKPLCLLGLISTDCAAAIVARFIRIKTN